MACTWVLKICYINIHCRDNSKPIFTKWKSSNFIS